MSTDWRTRVEQHLTRAWLQNGPTALALLPLAFLFNAVAAFHRILYRSGVLKAVRLPVNVVVVGNVIAGGAGKTPTVISVASQLVAEGYQVGIVSRGYGRQRSDVLEVTAQSSASDAGDEPLLLKSRLSLPTFVGKDRVAAIRHLLSKYPSVDTIVCDDGIQHLRLFRDVEIYVFDNRGVGNGLPLPAGPLRSPWPPAWVRQAGQDVQKAVILHTGSQPAFLGYHAQRSLAGYGIRRDGTAISLAELKAMQGPHIAVAGIAQPATFFQMLADAGIDTAEDIAFPDHYDYSVWARPALPELTILCTEKDAVKLWSVAPDAIAMPLLQTMTPDFYEKIRNSLAPPKSGTC